MQNFSLRTTEIYFCSSDQGEIVFNSGTLFIAYDLGLSLIK